MESIRFKWPAPKLRICVCGKLCAHNFGDSQIYFYPTAVLCVIVLASVLAALCSSLGSLGQIVNCKEPLEISVTVYISKPQYYRALKGPN